MNSLMVLYICGGAFLLFSLVRGWQRGVVRQSLSILAIVAAYLVGMYGGRLLLPFLRKLGYPDLALSVLAGCIMGLLVMLAITSLGVILFKKTSQQDVFLVRWGYGLGGALLSVGFGVFMLWFALIGIRLLGTVAETELKIAKNNRPPDLHDNRSLPPAGQDRPSIPDPGAFVHGVADLKHTVEQGPIGEFAERVDPLPGRVYSIMGNITRVISNKDAVNRFVDFPGVKKISENPKIRSLVEDPEIARAARDHNFFELMKNKRVVDALNDPKVLEMVKKIELEKALEFALKDGTAPAEPLPHLPASRSSRASQ